MKKHLSISERIHNAEGVQAAEYLHARHTYLHATSYCKEEWGEFWDTSEEATWGHLFGVMVGFDEVWYNSVVNYDPDGLRGYTNNVKQFNEIAWFDPRSIRELSMHTLATDIIEAADDGKTVRASFLTPGILLTALNANKKYHGLTLWERYGSDFIYDEEEGEWLYLHEQVCPDMGGPMDIVNPGQSAYNKLMGIATPGGKGPGPGPGAGAPPQGMGGAPGAGGPNHGADGNAKVAGMVVKEKGATRGATSAGGAKGEVHVGVPGPIHYNYTPIMHVQNTVAWPEPYKTMDKENTYRYYERPEVD